MDQTSTETERRFAELEARIADLTTRLTAATAPPADVGGTASPSAAATPTSRRTALRLAGAAVVGAIGVAATTTPAAADTGNPLTLGEIPADGNTTVDPTRVNYTGGGGTTNGFVFQAGSNITTNTTPGSVGYAAALAGWSGAGRAPASGVFGFSQNPGAYGVIGQNDTPTGTGVFGTSATGIGVSGSSSGPTGYGVIGAGGFAGVLGLSGDYSLASLLSNKANLYLQPNNNLGASIPPPKTRPSTRTDAHRQGEMENVDGDLWWCVVGGSPGQWRKISGPTVAGAYHAITPARVFDSRAAAPTPGLLSVGVPLAVSLAASRDLDTGAVLNGNLVPVGATAVLANVTIVNTVGSGFLTVNPGSIATVSSSTINWSATGQILNNGVSLTLGGDRQVTIVPGGSVGAATDVVIDVTGYFV